MPLIKPHHCFKLYIFVCPFIAILSAIIIINDNKIITNTEDIVYRYIYILHRRAILLKNIMYKGTFEMATHGLLMF